MLLMPRKVKFRKAQKGKNRGIAVRGSRLTFGEYGLKALENGLIRANHVETARITVARKMKGVGKLWINIFPSKPVTKKPAETRQGKGKGDLDHWVCPVKRGKILFEIGGVPENFAKTIFRLVAFKMPVRTKFVSRSGQV
ncbi:MAG: 50S ribosomal protein L16 [Candidatus Omnitrophica bacterium]|nr:50S ribosomal protein L16 [Candidatus Omnitrophota bacterium]